MKIGDLLVGVMLSIAVLLFTLIEPLASLPIRVPLGLIMVLFLPGYTLIAALFPRKWDLDGIERIALSFGMSIAIVPLIGLGLNCTPWGIRLIPVVISLSVFTISLSIAAYLRRRHLPSVDRLSVDFGEWLTALSQEFHAEMKSNLNRILTLFLVISIIASITALGYVIITPKQGEKFTEFYILGLGGKAYDYPTSVTAGNTSSVIIGIVNHEYDLVNYTVRIRINNSTLLEKKARLEHNQTWDQPISYTLRKVGKSQKLEFLLYKESNFTAPCSDLHLWVNVSR